MPVALLEALVVHGAVYLVLILRSGHDLSHHIVAQPAGQREYPSEQHRVLAAAAVGTDSRSERARGDAEVDAVVHPAHGLGQVRHSRDSDGSSRKTSLVRMGKVSMQ